MDDVIDNIEKTAIEYRGKIINHSITLERLIDFFLSAYFCSDPEKRDELILILLANEKISFSGKLDAFQFLIKSKNMKIYSSYPQLANEIKKVIEERNIFAHYYLSIEDGAKELPAGTVRFHKMKHAHTYVDYDEVKIKNLHDRIESLISYILKFIDD